MEVPPVDDDALEDGGEDEGLEEGEGGDEDLLSFLAAESSLSSSSSPAPPAEDAMEVEVVKEETPAPAPAATEPTPRSAVAAAAQAAATEAALAALLEQFEGAETVADRAGLEADVLHEAMEHLLGRCQQLMNAHAHGVTGQRLGDLRADIVAAMDAANLRAATLIATVRRHTANMAHVMSNVVCNHLARGPQDAPFFLGDPSGGEPQGDVEFCFNVDNPSLPPGAYGALPRVETRTVQLF